MDKDQEAARDTMVEPTVGAARVDLWRKGWTEPGDQSMRPEPGCLEESAQQRGRPTRATSTTRNPKAGLLAQRTEAETGTGWGDNGASKYDGETRGREEPSGAKVDPEVHGGR